MTRVLAGGLLVLVILGVGVAAGWWHSQGGRWFVVTSPSMGQAAPVGSLLITEPTRVRDVADGTFITFHPPGSSEVYSHRVVAHTGGGLSTRGDINLVQDPWTVTDTDLIGRVALRLPAVGWAVRTLPILACGLAITWLLTLGLRPTRRYSVRVIGASLTLAVAGWILHPWIGLIRLAQTSPDDGSPGVLMRVVSTGLLPITVNGDVTTLHDGQAATVHLTHADHGRYPLNAHPAFTWWQWVIVALIVLTPMLWTTIRGLPPHPLADPANGDSDTDAPGSVTAPTAPGPETWTDAPRAAPAPTRTPVLPPTPARSVAAQLRQAPALVGIEDLLAGPTDRDRSRQRR